MSVPPKIKPKDPTLNLSLGLVYYSQKKYEQGINTLEIVHSQALENQGEFVLDYGQVEQLYLFLSRCYFNIGQLDKATIILE